MTIKRRRVLGLAAAAWGAVFFGAAGLRVLADCADFGLPFTDLGATSFCAEIAEAYYTGISNGTSATTFSPSANITREQAAAFATRTLDAALTRGSRRAALGQWWMTGSYDAGLGITSLESAFNGAPQTDGADIWVGVNNGNPQAAQSSVHSFTSVTISDAVVRVRASDGRVLETWTGVNGASATLVAVGRVFVTGTSSLYVIDPSQPAGVATAVANIPGPGAIAFDGTRIWTTYIAGPGAGSVSIITPGPTLPWSVKTVTTSFADPGILFDGRNTWISDATSGSIDRLDGNAGIVQSVSLPPSPRGLVFDGRNIWVSNGGPNEGSLSVVRATDGVVLKTLSGNGLSGPFSVGFDGKRILVASTFHVALSLFDASSFEPLGSVPVLALGIPSGVCSDGINFWIAFDLSGKLVRF